MNGGLETETWAEANSYQDYKWRHGVMTQNELAHRCFGPHKYVLQRTVQQFMYMLENLGIPFGAAIFNNWIIPIMPLIPYEDRFGASWPAKYSLNRRSTLDLPVLGPDPVDVNNVDYVSVEFGDPSISFPSDNTDPVKYANYTRFSREAVFDRILQPMTICARDMNIDIRQGEPGAEPLHIFRALPDPYDLSRPLYPSTTCLDATKHQVPTLERGLLNFIFRGAEASAGKTDPQHSSGNSYPTIHSGDCFGDQLDDFKAPYSKDSLYPDPEINKYSSPCYYTATELPEWMTRDRSDAISSNDIGCSSDYDPPNYCFNRDDVNVSEIIAPYRLCPDTKTELENTLSNINAATVLSTIRAGGFSKSGYPLNVPAEATFPIANAKERYLTSPESLYVYPQREDPIEDDFLPGAFMTAYNIISSSGTTIPNPNNYNRVVVVFTDGVSRVSFDDVVGKDFNYTDWGQGGAWFSSIPSSDVLPIFEKVTSDPFPYSETSIKEALQLIHTMVDDGIKVVVVILDRIDKNGWDNALQQFFIDGLKEPIGETDTVGTTYRYALCKKCGAGEIWTNCNLPLSHEPAITANNPQNCINKPPREGIVLIQATKLFSTTPGDPTETYSTFHKRAFSSILPSLNRAINTFTLSK
ncbi:MAG: hypothetical protein D6808_06625 [Candidatus Dadabacteria bacterium]|nr:MAG: hypothetical protein D6808_06625 [Candidatus Dadabacteria bacterium]